MTLSPPDGISVTGHTGAPWRDLSAHFGPWRTGSDWFVRWRRDDTWDRLPAHVWTPAVSDG